MIHSLSGGVLGDNGVYTFAKVEVEGAPRWYVAPFPVKEGDTVAVPYGAVGEMQGRGIEDGTLYGAHRARADFARAGAFARFIKNLRLFA